MGEIGQVFQINGDDVRVRLERKAACASCRACSVGIDSKEMVITAKNLCGAELGGWVELEIGEGVFLQAVTVAYGVPLLMFLVGAFAGYYGALATGLAFAEIAAFVGGLVLALLSGLLLKRYGTRKKGLSPVAIRKVEQGELTTS